MKYLTDLTLLSWVLFLLIGGSKAYGFEAIEVDRIAFEYIRLNPENRDPYLPRSTGKWRERASLLWDFSFLKYGFMNNDCHLETTEPSGQVHSVGWKWEAGVHLGSYIDVKTIHHSRHVTEQKPDKLFDKGDTAQFPVENGVGVAVTLYKRLK